MEIGNAAKVLSQLSGYALSIDETVQGFCWLALELGTNCPGERQLWLKGDGRECWVIYPDQYNPPTIERALERQSDSSQKTPPSNAQLDLLCGAAYFNLVSVAEDLLQQSHGLRYVQVDSVNYCAFFLTTIVQLTVAAFSHRQFGLPPSVDMFSC